MPTYAFTGPRVTAKRTGQCPTCGKKATRSRTFEATVNPFNRNKETGEPKTWDEVRADVKAEAEAWQPEPEVFEHDKCYAERTAPPQVEPIPVPPDRLAFADKVRAGMAALAAFTEEHGLPLDAPDFCNKGNTVVGATLHIPACDVIAWARALGFSELRVYPDRDSTYIRIRSELPGVPVEGHTWISRQPARDPLGGTPVEWRHDELGRKASGTVTVDALAEGLAAMGIAVVDPTLPVEQAGDVA